MSKEVLVSQVCVENCEPIFFHCCNHAFVRFSAGCFSKNFLALPLVFRFPDLHKN